MKERSIKFQVTLSPELISLAEEEIKEMHMTRSTWLSKILTQYFKTKKGASKKVISLNIPKK